MAEEVVHRLVDKPVGDGLFGLVFVAGLGGEGGGYQNQAVLHILVGDLALIFQVFAALLQKAINLIDKGQLHRLLRGASMLQKTGVVVILGQVEPVGEGQRHREFGLVFRLVLPVPAPTLGLPVDHRAEGLFPAGQLLDIVGDAVGVAKLLFGKALLSLHPQEEGEPGIDHCLALEHVLEISHRHIDLGEYRKIRLPADAGSGLFAAGLLFLEAAHILPLLKTKGISESISEYLYIHIL